MVVEIDSEPFLVFESQPNQMPCVLSKYLVADFRKKDKSCEAVNLMRVCECLGVGQVVAIEPDHCKQHKQATRNHAQVQFQLG